MNEFMTDLSQLHWWMSVVVVGIVVNLLSNSIKKKYDDFFSSISAQWNNYSIARRNVFEARISLLANDPVEMAFEMHKENRKRVQSISSLVVSVIFMIALLFPKDSTKLDVQLKILSSAGLALSILAAFFLYQSAIESSVKVNAAIQLRHQRILDSQK